MSFCRFSCGHLNYSHALPRPSLHESSRDKHTFFLMLLQQLPYLLGHLQNLFRIYLSSPALVLPVLVRVITQILPSVTTAIKYYKRIKTFISPVSDLGLLKSPLNHLKQFSLRPLPKRHPHLIQILSTFMYHFSCILSLLSSYLKMTELIQRHNNRSFFPFLLGKERVYC